MVSSLLFRFDIQRLLNAQTVVQFAVGSVGGRFNIERASILYSEREKQKPPAGQHFLDNRGMVILRADGMFAFTLWRPFLTADRYTLRIITSCMQIFVLLIYKSLTGGGKWKKRLCCVTGKRV